MSLLLSVLLGRLLLSLLRLVLRVLLPLLALLSLLCSLLALAPLLKEVRHLLALLLRLFVGRRALSALPRGRLLRLPLPRAIALRGALRGLIRPDWPFLRLLLLGSSLRLRRLARVRFGRGIAFIVCRLKRRRVAPLLRLEITNGIAYIIGHNVVAYC